jgi:hypothetical protein
VLLLFGTDLSIANLSLFAVEEDFGVCRRLLARAATTA